MNACPQSDKPHHPMVVIDVLHPFVPTAILVKVGSVQAFAASIAKDRFGTGGRSSRLKRLRPFAEGRLVRVSMAPNGRYAAKRSDPAEKPGLNRRQNWDDKCRRSHQASDLAFHLTPMLGIIASH